MKPTLFGISCLLLFSFVFPPPAVAQYEDSLVSILQDELNREFNELKSKDVPPYYMDLRVIEVYSHSIQSNLGSIINRKSEHTRSIVPSIRVGDYAFDNTHTVENEFTRFGTQAVYRPLPVDNHKDAICYNIWEINNELYHAIVEEFITKQDNKDTAMEGSPGDFSREAPVKYFEPLVNKDLSQFDPSSWEERLNRYSATFKDVEGVTLGTCNFVYQPTREYFLNTEGTLIVQNKSICELSFFFICRSQEDEIIPFSRTFYARTTDKLPSEEEINTYLMEIKSTLIHLIHAPKGEPYTGPAILSAGASGVFFHEIFGHRVEGHRFDDVFNSKTFKEKIGQKVINESISVVFDPTLASFDGKDLMGHYRYDDQGITAQKVVNVENGYMKEFLMSRKPINGFTHSNGHGRSNIGLQPVARQSNMIISTSVALNMEELRKSLIKECRKQKLEYGYYFKTVSGGFTNTMNYMPDFFNIIPIEVYKIFVDGRPDELIRGVNLIGTPMIMFSEILAAGDKPEVFSGICGAESGSLPVSTVSPSILVRKIETQNQFAFKPEWPILPDPEKPIPELNK